MRKNAKSTAGSGNVFADIGFTNADEMLVKSDLVRHINHVIEQRGLTQVEAAEVLGVNQPKISALKRGRLTDFSIERLMRFLVSLGQGVEITVHPAPRATVRVIAPKLDPTVSRPPQAYRMLK
jgi:predicted XRE-type DNA-binding protein